ncbi:MAG: hypothetical protein A3F13_02035 [Gammaproteobacteria bacterium RIFCSPHIGHO2_12_FULL_40_19]|nr:MAG: hypothetical protein A3F13_02035 [Gammaproteobacteria bacterium RIFCSPHIGHO2_12_FULL_40_19]
MLISIIAALTTQGVIGRNNTLPWHLPEDLKRFKKITWGKPIVMGRKTFESIGKPLPGRQNIIVTHQKNLFIPGCLIVNSLEEAFEKTKQAQEVFIIGGATLYQSTIDTADFLYLTLIHAIISGNIHFPKIQYEKWEEIEKKDFPADQKNPYPFSFVLLKRK